MAVAGATAWRILGIGAVIVAAWLLARQLMPVLVPVVVALMFASLLRPVALRLQQRGWHTNASALAATGLLVLAVLLVGALIVPPFADKVSELGSNVEQGLREVARSIGEDVAGASREQADRAVDDLIANAKEQRGAIAGDIVAGFSALVQALGALVLIIFLTFFLVRDTDRIGSWFARLVPPRRRDGFTRGGQAAWHALGVYIRGVVFVATVDALFIGVALLLIGVPLVLPLVVLTWVAAFFPIVGAIVAGAVAVLVALVSEGAAAAVAVAVAIVLVQQLEGNVLYPMVVGPRLKLHPIAVLVAVLVGGTIGGVAGAFLAVPVAAVGATLLDLRDTDAPDVTRTTDDQGRYVLVKT